MAQGWPLRCGFLKCQDAGALCTLVTNNNPSCFCSPRQHNFPQLRALLNSLLISSGLFSSCILSSLSVLSLASGFKAQLQPFCQLRWGQELECHSPSCIQILNQSLLTFITYLLLHLTLLCSPGTPGLSRWSKGLSPNLTNSCLFSHAYLHCQLDAISTCSGSL